MVDTPRPTMLPNGRLGLADRLKAATQDLHRQAEQTGFIGDLLGGRATLTGYVLFLRNLVPVYEALEAGLQQQDATRGPLRSLAQPAFYRSAELRADLTHLHGPDWASSLAVLEAGAAYAERIRESSAEVNGAGLAGHAYVRTLGDLNGGQIMARLLSRHLRLPPQGLTHYAFHDAARAAIRYRRDIDALAENAAIDVAAIEAEAIASFRCAIALGEAIAAAA